MKIFTSFLFALTILAAEVSASEFMQFNKNINSSEDDPCLPYSPSMPGEMMKRRRISEQKCLEYTWALKVQREINDRRKQCYGKSGRGFGVRGGRDVKIGELPHVGAVGWMTTTGGYEFMCGCTLISKRFALTAAHCSIVPRQVGGQPLKYKKPVIVRLGAKNIEDRLRNDPIDASIKRIIRHPQYFSPYKYFDIALIELCYNQQFSSRVFPACIWDKENKDILSVAGWGATATEAQSMNLQVASVDYINSTLCQKYLLTNRLWVKGVVDHQICAGKLEGGQNTCKGDSGGPLQLNITVPIKTDIPIYSVIGITATGHNCEQKESLGIYTKVSSFIDWIEDIVWKTDAKKIEEDCPTLGLMS